MGSEFDVEAAPRRSTTAAEPPSPRRLAIVLALGVLAVGFAAGYERWPLYSSNQQLPCERLARVYEGKDGAVCRIAGF